MIKKYFQVVCDWCSHNINDYVGKRPTFKELKKDNIVVYNRKCFCNHECKRYFQGVEK